MPPALATRPELYPDLEPVADAFRILAAGRRVDVGSAGAVPQPIRLSDIRAYLDLFSVDEPETFVRLLLAMDKAWLSRVRERQDSTRQRQPAIQNDNFGQ